MSYTPMC